MVLPGTDKWDNSETDQTGKSKILRMSVHDCKVVAIIAHAESTETICCLLTWMFLISWCGVNGYFSIFMPQVHVATRVGGED